MTSVHCILLTAHCILLTAHCILPTDPIHPQRCQQGQAQHRRLQKAGGDAEQIPTGDDAIEEVFQRIVGPEGQQQSGQGEERAQGAHPPVGVTQSQQRQNQARQADIAQPFAIGLGAQGHAQIPGVVRQQREAQPPRGQTQRRMIPKRHPSLPEGEPRKLQRGQQLRRGHDSGDDKSRQRHGPGVGEKRAEECETIAFH